MTDQRLSTGIEGLDEIVDGGYLPERSYLLRGGPGTGKTTFGLHYLTAGIDNDENVLFITLDESKDQIQQDAKTMGFEPRKIDYLDLSPDPDFFSDGEEYDLYESSDIEWGPITEKIMEKVGECDPDRVFIDAITQLRHLSPDIYQFRKQVLSFIRYILSKEATVLIVSEKSGSGEQHADLQYLCDSVFELRNEDVRSLEVTKYRGSDYHEGKHHLRIESDGMRVFSGQLPQGTVEYQKSNQLSTGIPEFDSMLDGGIEQGTVNLFTGPTGVGKTTTGLQFVKTGASQGNNSIVYTFEETPRTLIARSNDLNIPVEKMLEEGHLEIEYIEPGEYTSGQFSQLVRNDAEQQGVSIVMIDSLSGYNASFVTEDEKPRIHELVNYLKRRGITVILVDEVSRITGDFQVSEEGVSYLSDNIVFLRYVEFKGKIRKVIGVLKKRMSDFEHNLREIEFTSYGMKVGEPLENLQGVLTGTPQWDPSSDRPFERSTSQQDS